MGTPARTQGPAKCPIPHRGDSDFHWTGRHIRYSPKRPFQGTIFLNMDSIRDQKDALFADHYGLRANVILLQDHRPNETKVDGLPTNAGQKAFRPQGRYCAVVSESPSARMDSATEGQSMVVVHPHHYGRVVDMFTDTRGPGRYVAVTLRGKNGVLITSMSVYPTPTPPRLKLGRQTALKSVIFLIQLNNVPHHRTGRRVGPGGRTGSVHCPPQRELPAREPCAQAVCDVAELVAERHRTGSVVVLGGDLQVDITDSYRPSFQLL